MIILSIIWFGYIIFQTARILLPRGEAKKFSLYQGIRFGWDIFLGLDLLAWGLSEKGIIPLDEWMFMVLGIIYFIGLVFIDKIKDPDKDRPDKGSDIDVNQK